MSVNPAPDPNPNPNKKFTSASGNNKEAGDLMEWITPLWLGAPSRFSGLEREFLSDMREKFKQAGAGLVVGNKQVERLRQIKERLQGGF